MTTKRFAVWLARHDSLLTFMTETEYMNRRTFINKAKPQSERTLRLYLMRKVKGELPVKVKNTYAAWVEADAASEEDDAARAKVIKDNLSALETLHRLEVPDTTWDGQTIFSEGWLEHPRAKPK